MLCEQLSRIQHLIDANLTVWGTTPEPLSALVDRQQFLLRELALSQEKCAKWEARKRAALAAKAELEKKKKK